MKMIQKVQKVFQRILVATLVFIFALSQAMTQEVSATTAQRNSAISAMTAMRNIQWVPNGDVTIYSANYVSNTMYTGMPYTQNADTTLSEFKTKPTIQYVSAINLYVLSQPASDIGNDCSASVAISWKAGGSAITVAGVSTSTMLSAVKSAANHMTKRGTYDTSFSYTLDMTAASSAEALYNGLIPGDACFYRTSSEGHAILITGINTSANTVTYIEQIGEGRADGSLVKGWRLAASHSTWTSGTMTFDQLKAAGFVPIRCNDI